MNEAVVDALGWRKRSFAVVAAAVALRLLWVGLVPTQPQSDYAMYLAAADHLVARGTLDPNFVVIPGWVALLALVRWLGGGLLACKLLGVAFAGLGAGSLVGLAARLFDRRVALLAGALYAIWPAGIALGSVLGTDIPFVAVLLTALCWLCTRAARTPWRASLGCGLLLGAACWLRLVALPLVAVVFVFWWSQRRGLRFAARQTTVAAAACVLLLLPWGLHNAHVEGHFSLGDHHGGATALLGAYPGTDGAYAPEALDLITWVTGAPFYAPPHAPRDAVAYRMATAWKRESVPGTVAIMVAHLGRLLGPDRDLLCWSFSCEAVLPVASRAPLRAVTPVLTWLADGFSTLVLLAGVLGMAVAWQQRPDAFLVLAFPMGALAATYGLYFGSPRYHAPLESLAFPLVALSCFTILNAARSRSLMGLKGPALVAAAALGAALLVAGVSAWVRDRVRWAVVPCRIAGAPRVCGIRARGVPSPILAEAGRAAFAPGAATSITIKDVTGDGLALEPGPWTVTVLLRSGASVSTARAPAFAGGPFLIDWSVPDRTGPLAITGVQVARAQARPIPASGSTP